MSKPINIIFDGPPSHKSGRFVEVETDDGKSIRAGEWIEQEDGMWALRITELPESREDIEERRIQVIGAILAIIVSSVLILAALLT